MSTEGGGDRLSLYFSLDTVCGSFVASPLRAGVKSLSELYASPFRNVLRYYYSSSTAVVLIVCLCRTVRHIVPSSGLPQQYCL